jgi:hypothetical protein
MCRDIAEVLAAALCACDCERSRRRVWVGWWMQWRRALSAHQRRRAAVGAVIGQRCALLIGRQAQVPLLA